MTENEIWKPIRGHENEYEISNLGRVRRKDTSNIRKPQYCREYEAVNLSVNGKIAHIYVHRAVWEAFNGEIPSGMQINHKDENPRNNRLDNLEMCTPKYNSNYGSHKRRLSCSNINNTVTSMPVIQLDMQGNFIKEWPSVREAGRFYGNAQNICSNLSGKYRHAYGFVWKYKH